MNTLVTKPTAVSGAVDQSLFLSPSKVKTLKDTWLKCPIDELSNMFYAQASDTPQKALSYQLPPAAFAEMMRTYQMAKKEGKNGVLKIHMGCDEGYTTNSIQATAPAFSPFMQLRLSGEEGHENCYRCEWQAMEETVSNNTSPEVNSNTVRVTSENNPSRISPNSAYLFLKEWRLTDRVDLPGLFMGMVKQESVRINCTTFLEQTLDDILRLWEVDNTRKFFLHLAAIKIDDRTPFDFHAVLEVAEGMAIMDMDVRTRVSAFFEYSYPCPPFCTGPRGCKR